MSLLDTTPPNPPCELDRGMPLRILARRIGQYMEEHHGDIRGWRDASRDLLAYMADLIGYDPEELCQVLQTSRAGLHLMCERARAHHYFAEMSEIRSLIEDCRREHGTLSEPDESCPYRHSHTCLWRQPRPDDCDLKVFVKGQPQTVSLSAICREAGIQHTSHCSLWLCGECLPSDLLLGALAAWAEAKSRGKWRHEAARLRRIYHQRQQRKEAAA